MCEVRELALGRREVVGARLLGSFANDERALAGLVDAPVLTKPGAVCGWMFEDAKRFVDSTWLCHWQLKSQASRRRFGTEAKNRMWTRPTIDEINTLQTHSYRSPFRLQNPESLFFPAYHTISSYTGLRQGAISRGTRRPGSALGGYIFPGPWEPYRFFGLMTSKMIMAAMINSRRKMIFRLVVFFW